MSFATKLTQNLSSLRPKSGYLRSVEYAAIAVALLTIAGVGYLSFQVYNDRTEQLSKLQVEDSTVRRQIKDLEGKVASNNDRDTKRKAVLENLQEFTERYLKDQTRGRVDLIDELNKLIKANNLSLQGGINFIPIEDADQVAAQEEKAGVKGRRRSNKGNAEIYPGLKATFNITGSYENFRKFLHSLETNDLFIIIDRLDLQNKEANAPAGRGVQIMQIQGNGDLNVQVDVKTYFRKQIDVTNQ